MDRRTLLSIYNSIPVGICVINQMQHVVFVNQAFEASIGVPGHMLVNKSVTDIFPIFKEEFFQLRLNAVFSDQMPMFLSSGLHGSIFSNKFNKNASYFEVSVSPVFWDGQHELLASFTVEDVTDLMCQIDYQKHLLAELNDKLIETEKAKQALSESRELLKQANEAKDKLFSIIGHDLKTPFNTLSGISELLLKTSDPSDAERMPLFEAIWLASKDGLELVTNLLTWAQSQTGRIQCYTTSFEVTKVLNELRQFFLLSAKRKKISLNVQLAENCFVDADIDMIKVVLQNLIANAIKFTPGGGFVEISAQSIGNDEVEIRVSDNGVGLSEQMTNELLQGKESASRLGTDLEMGTGLGLIVCREFLALNSSQLKIESSVGQGSVFSFVLKQSY
jgi:PAS domain S-box-containing protein